MTMRPFSSMSKAACRLLSRRRQQVGVQIGSMVGWYDGFSSNGGLCTTRQFHSIIKADPNGVVKERDFSGEGILRRDVCVPSIGAQQARCFLGCGDGDEDCGLTRTYEEKRVVGYSSEQLFAVVAAVDMYEDFVPWCQRSTIIRRKNDEAFDAELQIGFKFLVERYISHVELKKPNYIKSTASDSNIFKYLINIWEFNNGPIPGSCDLHFFVDFQFQSPLYRQVASMFFKEVVSRLVGSFEQRCNVVYGPAVKVLEDAYGSQRV